MGANKNQEKEVGSKCRITSSFVIFRQSIKLVKKCSVYPVNWVTTRCNSTWMTGRERIAKDGYFPVITTGNGEPKKFMVELAYLSYPPFIGLLEAAEKEFGFEQQGVLAIPCEATALQNILLHVCDDLTENMDICVNVKQLLKVTQLGQDIESILFT